MRGKSLRKISYHKKVPLEGGGFKPNFFGNEPEPRFYKPSFVGEAIALYRCRVGIAHPKFSLVSEDSRVAIELITQ